MQESNQKKLQHGTPLCGMVCGLVGVIIALSLIFLGFWKTLLILVMFGIGYVLGAFSNKKQMLDATINTITNKDE